MRKVLQHIVFFSALLALAGGWGCSTEKNKALNRGYHNMTARYNGYFNANELIRESLKTFRDSYKEDYTNILPVFVYADEKSASALYPDMDKAISKTSVVIDKHSMPNPKKSGRSKKDEWCKWIDNNWFLMGQAHFYKREFYAAREKFEYVKNTYKNLEIKYDATLWLAKTAMEEGSMEEARKILDKMQSDREDAEKKAKERKEKKKEEPEKKSSSKKKSKSSKKRKTPAKASEEKTVLFPEYLKKDFAATYADFYIRTGKYEKAIEKLGEAIKLTKKKRERARLTFILAQLYQKTGNGNMASETYGKVLKLNPTFEMEFYSKINRAILFEGGDSRGIRAELMKLLKDQKNKDYFDQIYYALAEIEFKEDDREEGIYYLNKSIETSISNDKQKGKSYLRLADLHFSDRNYVPAKAYYDSSLAVLPKDYSNYEKISDKSKSLTELVEHLTVVKMNDSLLNFSKLNEEDLDKKLAEIAEKEIEEEERKKRAEEERLARIKQQENKVSDNSWYFYNAQTMAFGNKQFKQIWGVRKLEDDWRRSNKESFNEDAITNITEVSSDSLGNIAAQIEKRKEAYKKKIPRGPEDISKAKTEIMTSLYMSGVIFKDQLNQKDLATKQFLSLLKKYDDGEYVLPSKYQLYLLYEGKSDQEPYKKDILENHSESEYAQLIRNPNFKRQDDAEKQKEEDKYALVYELYQKREFEKTLTACNDIILKEPKNHYLPHYYFLRAMSLGEMRQAENFEKALSECADKFPKHETGKEAAGILDYMRNKKSTENVVSGGGIYVYESEAEHFFMLIFPNSMGSINDAKAKFSDFHSTYFSSKGLKVSNNFLDTDNQLILVKSFENKQKAMEYYQAFLNENDKLKNLKTAEYFVITSKNYASFFVEKKTADYKKFFQDNYLK